MLYLKGSSCHFIWHLYLYILCSVFLLLSISTSVRGEEVYVLSSQSQSCPREDANITELSTVTINLTNYTEVAILSLPTNHTLYVRKATLNTIESLPRQVCFCNTQQQPDCDYDPPPIQVKKGEEFSISLITVDQELRPVEAAITSSLLNGGAFNQGQQTQKVQGTCTDVPFNIVSPLDEEVIELVVEGSCGSSDPFVRRAEITFSTCTCPIGFQPTSDETRCECECDSLLKDYIIGCNTSNNSIIKQGVNVWITYVNESNSTKGFVIEPNCPYDYCIPPTQTVSINLNLPNGADVQCAFNRTGILCGACRENFSLSLGSSECVVCNDSWPAVCLAIILASGIVGILLVSTLLALNMTVADGRINVFIFYANIVAASMNSYFSFSESRFPTVFISWLNLDFGFNVCFIDGLDAYGKVWLQLAFPAYIISLVVLVIIISEYSPRFARLIGKRDPVATLATLILLSYAKLLSTSLLVFSYDTLAYPNHDYFTVWLPDGNVPYYAIKRIPFLIVVFSIIFIGFVYTFLLFSWQWLVRTPRWKILRWTKNTKLNAFIATYHAPYNNNYRYWTGLLLFVRVIVYITTAFTASDIPQIPLLVTIILLGCIMFLKEIMGMRIYKKVATDVIETIMYLNLLIFAVFSLTDLKNDNRTKRIAVSHVSTLLALILLIGIITSPLAKYIWNRMWKKNSTDSSEINTPAHTSKSNNVTHTEIGFDTADTDTPYREAAMVTETTSVP